MIRGIKKYVLRKLIAAFRIVKKAEQMEKYDHFRSKYSIHPTFRFNGDDILFYGRGEIVCGKGSYVGSLSTIEANAGCKVLIGENCAISHNVRIYTTSYDADQDFSVAPLREKMGNVTIGDNVWIGVNVFIGPGTSIGINAVIGANSVVTKDIPPNAICGGIPAKVIRNKSGS